MAIPCVAPIALGGFYSFNGMSFYEYMGKKLYFLFANRTLTFVSIEGEPVIKQLEAEQNLQIKKNDGLVVGQRIRNLRIEAGYGLGEFSDELGKSESHIKQVELGSRKILLDLLISLMEVLYADANSILGESSDHKDNSIDAKLQELPEPQRQYFTTMFLTMLANYSAAA